MKQNPHQRIVGSDGEGHPRQAGIQGRVRRARMSGRQELRQDRCPHGVERRFLHEARNSGSRRLGYHVFDVQSAYLQSNGLERLFRNPPPGTKSVLEAAGFVGSRLEQGFYYLPGPDGLEVSRTHTRR